MSDDRGASGSALILAFLAGAVAGVAVAALTSPTIRQAARRALDEALAKVESRDA